MVDQEGRRTLYKWHGLVSHWKRTVCLFLLNVDLSIFSLPNTFLTVSSILNPWISFHMICLYFFFYKVDFWKELFFS